MLSYEMRSIGISYSKNSENGLHLIHDQYSSLIAEDAEQTYDTDVTHEQ